jgi:hypothetical protein
MKKNKERRGEERRELYLHMIYLVLFGHEPTKIKTQPYCNTKA